MLEDDMDDLIVPPEYDIQNRLCSPLYSAIPRASEVCLQQCELSPRTTLAGEDWIFETRSLKINLGPRKWALSTPCYGLDGKVEGSVIYTGNLSGIEKLTVALEGQVTTSVPQRAGTAISPLFSTTVSLYDSSPGTSSSTETRRDFSIPFPAHVTMEGSSFPSPIPPSFDCYHYAATCQVSYSLKVSLTRKGKTLRKHELKSIPILYYPKTSPIEPPLARIPRPSRSSVDGSSPLYLHMFDRVETTPLIAFWPSTCRETPALDLDVFKHSVNFSIPTPKCFSSGETIPFTLSLVFPHQPALSQILVRSIRVVLFKRVVIWCHKTTGRSPMDASSYQREWPMSNGRLKYLNEYSEGMVLLRGFVDAGGTGKECSWKLEDVAEVQYVLQVSLVPPLYLKGHVPCFRHEEVVEITTDCWGEVERDLRATGGVPTPALGLINSSESGDDGLSQWGWAGM